jgi:hypothetical protein
MSSRLCIRIILVLMAFAVSTFDRHLSAYLSGETALLVNAESMPEHQELPAQLSDNHEDIALKPIYAAMPAPLELSLHTYLIFQITISPNSPHSMWQPPENCS